MGFWGPLTGLSFALDPSMTNAGEHEYFAEKMANEEKNQNPQPINPLKDYGMKTNEYQNEAIDTTTPQSYDLLDVMKKSKNPAINYEGLYEDPMPKTRSYNPFKAMRSDVVLDQYNPSYYKNNPDMLSPSGLKYDDLHLRMDFERANQGLMPYNRWSRGIDDPRFENFSPRVGQSLGYQEAEAEADQDIDLESLRDPFANNLIEERETISTPLDMERFAGVSELGRNDEDVEQVEYLGSPSKFQNFKSRIDDGLGSFRNKASQGWDFAQQLPGMAMGALSGIPGIGMLMNAIGNQFEDRQLTGDIMDESGIMYSAADLNKMNAKGGYYTDPARSARRRTSRIANMRNRLANDKKISDKNLHELVAQEKAQQLRDAQNAADRANIQNIQNYTGQELSGYRMSRPASERGFTGHGKSGMGRDPDRNKAQGGRVGYGNGGLATLFTRRG